MTFAEVTAPQLPIVWGWIAENPHLHMSEEGPKTLKAFVDYLLAENITLISVNRGHKFVGVIGVKEWEEHNEIRGIHFIPEARGQGIAMRALSGVIMSSDPKPVRLRFLADNPYMLRFIAKFKGHFIPTDAKAHRGDAEIPFFAVELHA